MTSSMSAGERRWASAKRGGMTVLGRVAAPKPLNLPSQRLENHGLDPSVEIVPKGTLSWGSRSSSSASNAWGSSTLSPKADGSACSLSNLSGRPSSSGSSTRPSSAGSNRTHEPTLSAWGPNSRPASASGALSSNQTLVTSSRPRTAETRPGSSQLSRFAGPSSDNTVAWGPPGTTEKLGMASTKKDGFSLSSGDFPTLGSERENSERNSESLDHGSYGRPDSSSSRTAAPEERNATSSVGDGSASENAKSGTVITREKDGSRHEDGFRPSVEKWQGEPQPYPNTSVLPNHFDAWHGPPMNAPAGVWYGGPPVGPPYGAPVTPGGFPIEPFPYCRPLSNSHPIPPPGVGPRGPHPTNGDLYRPHIPDAYIRPGMPIRPGLYPGPVAYEGYYGPPMGYCNSNERDIPFMGMQARPSGYNRYPSQNARDPSNNHGTMVGHGTTGKTIVSKQVESGRPDNTRGPSDVLLKQHSEWGGEEEEGSWEQTIPANGPHLEKGNQPMVYSLKDEWGADYKMDEEMHSKRLNEDAFSRTFDKRGGYSSESFEVKFPESLCNGKAVDDIMVKESGNASAALPEGPQAFPASPKDATLIRKMEGLNVKARVSDGQYNAASISSREVQYKKLQVGNAKTNCSANAVGTDAVCTERTHASGDLIPISQEVDISGGDKTLQPAVASGTSLPRRSHGMHGRTDHRGKRFNNQDAVGWRKEPIVSGSMDASSSANHEPTFNVHVQDHHISGEVVEKYGIIIGRKYEGESLTPMFDPSESEAQRAKMREIAKQRAKQLQEEEEERTREQKAKALAKLEELNRRIQVADGSTQNLEKALPGAPMHQEKEVSQENERTREQKAKALAKLEELNRRIQVADGSTQNLEKALPGAPMHHEKEVSQTLAETVIVFGSGVVAQISEGNTSGVETPDAAQQESVVPYGQSLPLQQDPENAGTAYCKAPPQENDGGVSRHKRMGLKQKQNIPMERNLTAEPILTITTKAPKNRSDGAVNDIASTEVVAEVGPSWEPSLLINPNIMAESTTHQRRKNHRSSKNKHKLEPSIIDLGLPVPKETSPAKASIGSGKSKVSEVELDPCSVQSLTDAELAIQPSEPNSLLPSEESTSRVNNQWKSQQSRRMQRNPQAIRSPKFRNSDAVVWAPVRSQNKYEVTDEASHKNSYDAVTPTGKSENLVQSSLKSKRAEMERYVPKHVAKELAQQGSIQQPCSTSINQTTLGETAGGAEPGFQSIGSLQPADSAIGNVASTEEYRNGNNKQNKSSKADGSSITLNHGKNVQKSMDKHRSFIPDVDSVEGQLNFSDEWNTSEGWKTTDKFDTAAPVTSPVMKDQGVTRRGKQHPFKGHRGTGNNYDHDRRNVNSEGTFKSYRQSAAPESSQADRTMAMRENRGVGERTTSHWQPKSQAHSAHYHRGRSDGAEIVNSEVGKAIKKDSLPKDRVDLPPQDKESSGTMAHSHLYQSPSEHESLAEAQNVGHQEAKREKKVASFKGRPRSPNQGPVNMVKSAPTADMDIRHEQRFPSGFRKNGNPNHRSGRGRESRGEWTSAGQDSKHHNIPTNQEMQGHDSHYEYQPAGTYSSNGKSNNFQRQDGSHNTSSRYRERGQGPSRRGGGSFYGRQSSAVGVDTGYD
ncbi:protein MODIFIER OF SNC1 1-like isoform X2 [Cornus florida]|uniref:protein MODIFIER OF SNC1 1-like isoform X2 n=1 Tax=Cornus florida TaxID=4283 RepID=UPI00289F8A38|nr:protein MODIFIER OF SNC1 1-like isoform X2 [Cornus florida]